jgi:hypothetical protein
MRITPFSCIIHALFKGFFNNLSGTYQESIVPIEWDLADPDENRSAFFYVLL